MRVPWNRFQKAYEEYLRWEAFTLWVMTIVDIEGSAPSWVVATLKQRCPGFLEKTVPLKQPGLLGFNLREWIHNQVFGDVEQEGWLDALLFYGVRDVRSQRTWAYWEHCEEEWHRRPPSPFPGFEEWLRLARNYNPDRETSVTNLAEVLEQYVEWKIFACWLEPLTKAKIELPKRITKELERRCPGFLDVSGSNSTMRHHNKANTGQRLMNWIEDQFFSDAKKEGWLDCIRLQAQSHPLYARVMGYSRRWNRSLLQNPTAEYPSFVQWCSAAENYIEE
jgi:hypothetical protein